MDKGQAKKTQDDLDAATKTLRALIKYTERAADEACARGDNDTSAKFRRAQGHLVLAYAEGRTICAPDGNGGMIQPLSGGK